jgi:branched-chain amino acid transport system permease protein
VQSSLFWFTAVVVFGADSAAGAVAAAGLVVTVGILTSSSDAALVPIGLLALLIGRFPGGVVDVLRRLGGLRRVPALHRPVVVEAPRRLSPAGRALLERARS